MPFQSIIAALGSAGQLDHVGYPLSSISYQVYDFKAMDLAAHRP